LRRRGARARTRSSWCRGRCRRCSARAQEFWISISPLRDLDFGLCDDAPRGVRAERRQLDARRAPASVQQRPSKWRLTRHVTDQSDSSRVHLRNRRRLAFAAVENGFEREVAIERAAASGVDVANGGSDLGIAVRRDVFHQEVDETAITLKQRKYLNGPIHR